MTGTTRVGGLAATVSGAGPPLLLLHGIGSSRAAFAGQIEHFARHYRCICPDAPGYGDSPDPPPISDMDGYAEVYEHLLGEVDQGPAAIVGVSFGGVVAARLAMRARVPLAAIVLADSSRGSGVDAGSAAAMRDRPRVFAEVGSVEFAAQRAPRLVAPRSRQELVDSVAATMTAAIRLPGYAYAAEAMAVTDHTDSLARIACPTLVVVGAEDAVCPPEESQAIAAAIPSARYVEIADAGHLANQEQPDSFNAAVEAFLAAHHPSEGPSAG